MYPVQKQRTQLSFSLSPACSLLSLVYPSLSAIFPHNHSLPCLSESFSAITSFLLLLCLSHLIKWNLLKVQNKSPIEKDVEQREYSCTMNERKTVNKMFMIFLPHKKCIIQFDNALEWQLLMVCSLMYEQMYIYGVPSTACILRALLKHFSNPIIALKLFFQTYRVWKRTTECTGFNNASR